MRHWTDQTSGRNRYSLWREINTTQAHATKNKELKLHFFVMPQGIANLDSLLGSEGKIGF